MAKSRRRAWLALLVLLEGGLAAAPAADVVLLKPTGRGASPVRVPGEVLDFTGRELRLRLTSGSERVYPAARVVGVETVRSAAQRAGDRARAAGQWSAALAQYQAALEGREERREWVRREILASSVWCQRGLGRWDEAGATFLRLWEGDPHARHFAAIPLPWMRSDPSPELERRARQWLDAAAPPAAVLLGASHLLATGQRGAAMAALARLSRHSDERVAALAEAQSWRSAALPVDESQCAAWLRRIDQMPEGLRGGPSFVAGSALATRRPELAAAVLLRVPMHEPPPAELAVRAVELAAASLRGAGREDEAARVEGDWSGAAGSGAALYEERLARALQARGLYRLAVEDCEAALARAANGERRVALTVELVRSLAEYAPRASGAARGAAWQRAAAAAAELLRAEPHHPRLVLVRLQAALAIVAQGESERLDAELAGDEAALMAARQTLRRGLPALGEVRQALQGAQRRAGPEPDPGALTAEELAALAEGVELELARAYREQALCFAPRSADQVNALTLAVERLEPLVQLPDDVPRHYAARLERARCARGLEDLAGARRWLEVDQARLPKDLAAAWQAERIRVEVAAGQRDAACRLAAAAEQSGDADLNLAALEAYVAAWRAAGSGSAAEPWRSAAQQQAQRLERLDMPLWQARAAQLMAAAPGAEGGENWAALARAAESLWRAGQADQAARTYLRAAEAAAERGAPTQAFELGLAGGTILHQVRHHALALQQLRKLALGQPSHPRSAEAHLLAAWNAGQLAKGNDQTAGEQYERLLVEHRQTWPQGRTADEAAYRLGRWRQTQRRWAEALEALAAVGDDSEHLAAALAAVGECALAQCAAARDRGESVELLLAQARARLDRHFLEPAGKVKPRLSGAGLEAAAARVRLDLWAADTAAAAAANMIQAALAASPTEAGATRAAAQLLLVEALAGSGEVARGSALLGAARDARGADWLDAAARLARLAAGGREGERELTELRLRVLEEVDARRGELSDEDLRRARMLRGGALSDAGRHGEAITLWRQVAGERPRDGGAQESLAAALARSPQAADRQAALAKWRQIEQHSRIGSPRWLRASYALAETYLALGQNDRAAAVVRLAQASCPELGGPEEQARFRALLARCQEDHQGPRM